MATKKTQEPNLPKLFAQLQAAGQDGDYDKGLELSEKILTFTPEDPDVLHFMLVCLVQLSKFQDSLKLIDRLNKNHDVPQFLFEKAYCLYRLEKYTESKKVLVKLPQSEVKVRELLAQLHYKQEQYEEASTIYGSLVNDCSDDFTSDREANYAAALSFSCHDDPSSLPTDTMEQCFNVACCLLESGRGQEAEQVLKRAEDLCRATLQEDDYTEEEIEEEMSVVRVQIGYALQAQGRHKEALEMYNAILKQKPDDVSQTVIASNNVIVLNKDRDVFDSKKKIKVLASEGNSKRLTQTQKRSVLYNRCLFALQTNHLDACREMVSVLKSSRPNDSLSVAAEVGLRYREKKLSQAVESLESHLKSTHSADVSLYLTLAQLHLQHGHTDKSTQVLRSIPDVSKYVGVVSTLVSLYTARGQVGVAIEVLDEAVAFWVKGSKSNESVDVCHLLMLESGKYKLAHGRSEAAANVLEKLHQQLPNDLKVTAMLISAYSRYNPKLAEDLSRSLTQASISGSVDVDTLEQMPSFRHSRRHKTDHPETKSDVPSAPATKAIKKKKRKPRLPKNFDPNTPVDKERWLPLRERSYFKRGKRKGFIGSGRGSQGTTVASAALMASLDASKQKTQDTGAAPKQTRSGGDQPTSPRNKPTQAQKKKPKKKGKGKW